MVSQRWWLAPMQPRRCGLEAELVRRNRGMTYAVYVPSRTLAGAASLLIQKDTQDRPTIR